MSPLFVDAFRGVGMNRFERDTQGNVSGLRVDYSWLKNLYFVRESTVDDGAITPKAN